MPEVLGMDYETFTRSALLAQGAFTELLRAQVDDRAAILEKITGTKLYSTIGQWVFERCRDENNKVKRLLVHLEGAEMLAEDARKALKPPSKRLQTKPSMFGFAAVNSKRISAGYVRQQPPAHV